MNDLRWRIAAVAGVLAAACAAPARPCLAAPASVTGVASPAIIDTVRRADANRVRSYVTNLGWFGWNLATAGPGLFYPAGTGKSLLFAGGLWVAGKADGALRTSVAEFFSEFSPGRILGGTFDDPSRPEYRVYKVSAWRGGPADTGHVVRSLAETAADPTLDPLLHHSWSEYLSGAAPHGAPVRVHRLPDPSTPDPGDSVEVLGPDVLGDQMLWAVFNDASPALHVGRTAPLSIEVQLSAWSYDRDDALGDVVFLRHRIINKGTATVDSLLVGLWADPDVGGSHDDLAGSDSLLGLVYAYNAPFVDMVYGTAVPAIGHLGLSPPEPAALNATLADPETPLGFFNLMSGRSENGDPIQDPGGQTTTYRFSGDPVSGQGWIAVQPGDYRMLLSHGPFTLAAGDTQSVVSAIVVGSGSDPLASVHRLKCVAAWVRDLHQGLVGPEPVCAAAPVRNCPRPEFFWRQACAGSGLDAGELDQIAACADARSRFFDWASAPRESLCALLSSAASDPASRARRGFAALLASRCAGELGIVPDDAQEIFLDTTSVVGCGPGTTLADVTRPSTERALIDATYLNLNTTHRRALAGVGQGLEFFEGGADESFGVLGSSLDPDAEPDSFPSVELRFLPGRTAYAHRFLRLEVNDGTDDGPAPPQGRLYRYAGYYPVAVEAWDMGTGRRLEVAFVERVLTLANGTILPAFQQPASFDSTWRPTAGSHGGHELLLVARREYAGTPRVPEIGHDGAPTDGATPFLYTLWSRLRASSDVIDGGDLLRFLQGYRPPGADARLLNLAEMAASDPVAVAGYGELAACLEGLNVGTRLPLVCAVSTSPVIVHRSTETNADRVRITWTYQGHDGTQAVVERCDPLGCVVRAAASGQAPGQVSFEDEVQLGGTYTYRLGLPAGGRLHNSAPVHVVVPFAASIQLLSVSPNPTPGPIQVTFLLLSGAPATLALHDLQGRKVMSQPVSFPVVGRQSVTLDAPSDLGAGIYFVTIEQGGRTAARRIVLIR